VCFVDAPSIYIDAKRKLVAQLTAAIADAYHSSETMIFLREYPIENVGAHGRLQSKNPQFPEALKKVHA
jgi:phenylpyruvate tautomerase PptA (4-oxalocrotonate tautomerase family)